MSLKELIEQSALYKTDSTYTYPIDNLALYDQQCKIQEEANSYKRAKLEQMEAVLIKNNKANQLWYGKTFIKSMLTEVVERLSCEFGKLTLKAMKNTVSKASVNKLFQYVYLLQQVDIETLAILILSSGLTAILQSKDGALSHYTIALMISDSLLEEINFNRLLEKKAKKNYVDRRIVEIKQRFSKNKKKLHEEVQKLLAAFNDEAESLERKDKVILGEALLHIVFGTYPHIPARLVRDKETDKIALIIEQHKQEQEGNKQLTYWAKHKERGHKKKWRWLLLPCEWLINQINNSREALAQIVTCRYPMLIKPALPDFERDSHGYLKYDRAGQPLRGSTLHFVKYQNRAYFNKHVKGRSMPLLLSTLKHLQNTKYIVDPFILSFQRNCLNQQIELPEEVIPAIYEKELPAIDQDNPLTLRRFMQAKKKNRRAAFRRQAYIRMLSVVKQFAGYNTLYFPWQLGKNGRLYCVPWPSLQGADYERTLYEFAEKESVNETGLFYLKVWLANCFKTCYKTDAKLNQLSLTGRVAWVNTHLDQLILIGQKPLIYTAWHKADKPFMALKACYTLAMIDKDSAYKTGIRVDIDFSCSGLQIVSMLLGCKALAQKVNLLPNERPADIYIEIAENLELKLHQLKLSVPQTSILKERALAYAYQFFLKQRQEKRKYKNIKWSWVLNKVSPILDDYYTTDKHLLVEEVRKHYWQYIAVEAWLSIGITRSIVKRPVMTFTYSSRPFGMKKTIYTDTLKPLIDSDPDKYESIIPCRDIACYTLAENIYEMMHLIAPAAALFMNWAQANTRIIIESMEKDNKCKPLTFVMPTNFVTETDYRLKDKDNKNIKIRLPFDKKEILLSYHDENRIDKTKTLNAIAPTLVHMLDALIACLIVYNAALEGIVMINSNHDCFGTHPNNIEKLHRIVRQTLVYLFTPETYKFSFEWRHSNGEIKRYSVDSLIDLIQLQFKLQVRPDLRDQLLEPPIVNDLDLSLIMEATYCCS